MNEKTMLGLNLNAKLKKQIAKRIDAPLPSDAALDSHIAALVAAPVAKAEITAQATVAPDTGNDWFFEQWDRYYPLLSRALGWISWTVPGGALQVIKSMLAVVNNDLFPLVRVLLGRADLMRLVRAMVTSPELITKMLAVLTDFEKTHRSA